jgi:uroporphyrin-III C-methyltransferase/precorrin-2 dehydrogenase/sirohydrochlorin ferrochelatase
MMRERKMAKADAGRLGALARLPLFFSLHGKRAVVAGGSAAAAWKAELLSAAGAETIVYATDVSAAMEDLAAAPPGGRVIINRLAWSAADLPGAAVAIGDFTDDNAAAAFSQAARACGVPVNVIDRPVFCDFSFGAIVNRSPLVVGISTDGAAPAFAQAIRGKIEALLPAGFAAWTAAAARWRGAVKQSGLSRPGRRKFWELFAARALLRADSPPDVRHFHRLVADAAGEAADCGGITTVAVDPEHPDLLTLRDIRALQAADVIVFDDTVPHEALDFARREARKIPLRRTNHPLQSGGDGDARAQGFAAEGERVVLVTSRDRAAHAQQRLSSAA